MHEEIFYLLKTHVANVLIKNLIFETIDGLDFYMYCGNDLAM